MKLWIWTLLVLGLVACEHHKTAARDAGADANTPEPSPTCSAAPATTLQPGQCRADGDCAAGSCRSGSIDAVVDLQRAVLVCVDEGPVVDSGKRCGSASDCQRGLCTLAGTCVDPCGVDTDCGDVALRWCSAVYVRGPSGISLATQGCIPRFQVADGIETSFAVAMPRPAPDRQDASQIDVEALGGFERKVHSLLSQCPVTLNPIALRSSEPSNLLLFDVSAIALGSAPPINPIQLTPLRINVLMPSGSTMLATSSDYQLTFGGLHSEPLSVATTSGRRFGGVLDVDVFYAGAPGWSPTGLQGPLELTQALQKVAALYAAAGVTLGEVRQHEISGALREKFEVIDQDDEGKLPELPELLALSAGVEGPSIALFFVRAVDGALGYAGGIPGALGLAGTASSGVVIGAETAGDLGFDLGVVLAHEMSHFFGLFHTTEFNGIVVDSLEDTPLCAPSSDANGDGLLSPLECASQGANNLMFWRPQGNELSPMQLGMLSMASTLR